MVGFLYQSLQMRANHLRIKTHEEERREAFSQA